MKHTRRIGSRAGPRPGRAPAPAPDGGRQPGHRHPSPGGRPGNPRPPGPGDRREPASAERGGGRAGDHSGQPDHRCVEKS